MSQVSLTDADYRWVSEKIVEVANSSALGRIVSVLEGGYELRSLARCVDAHIRVLMDNEFPVNSPRKRGIGPKGDERAGEDHC
jgi:acetoin utilization deacetylase AcuC-like enzyme